MGCSNKSIGDKCMVSLARAKQNLEGDLCCDSDGMCLHMFSFCDWRDKSYWWTCKYCGENEKPKCHQCVREDGKLVEDELHENY